MPVAETTVAQGVAAAGITVFGVATGLDPALLLGGVGGGWWALMQFEVAAGLLYRAAFVALSGLLGAWLSPIAVAIAIPLAKKAGLLLPVAPLSIALSVMVGLLAIKWLGPRIVKAAGVAADSAERRL